MNKFYLFRNRKIIFYLASLIFFLPLVYAHEEDLLSSLSNFTNPLFYLLISSILLIIAIGIALKKGNKLTKKYKKIYFLIIVISISFSSIYLAVHTITDNINSQTKGPVHWHADYEVFVCGERLDLINPKFPSNKVGSPLFHEHDDDRIHIEGTVDEFGDIDLGSFFEIIGGKLQKGYLKYPTVNGVQEAYDGQTCGGKEATLEVYVNGKKINDFENYLIYPSPLVPPGDCIIISFEPDQKSTTKKICESWSAKDVRYDSINRTEIKIGEKIWQ